MSHLRTLIVAAGLLVSLTGCSAFDKRADLVANGHIKPETDVAAWLEQKASSRPSAERTGTKGSGIELATPTVTQIGDQIVISGTVTRTGPLPTKKGHLELLIISPDGTEFFGPVVILTDPADTFAPSAAKSTNGVASYSVRYGLVPAPGSIIRVTFSDSDYIAPTAGGSVAPSGSGYFTKTPSMPSMPTMQGTLPTPGIGSGGRSRGR